MKLSQLLEPNPFPVREEKGYAGNQDGSIAVFALLYLPLDAKKTDTEIPDQFHVQWCMKHKNEYEISLAAWSNAADREDWGKVFQAVRSVGGQVEFDPGQYEYIS